MGDILVKRDIIFSDACCLCNVTEKQFLMLFGMVKCPDKSYKRTRIISFFPNTLIVDALEFIMLRKRRFPAAFLRFMGICQKF